MAVNLKLSNLTNIRPFDPDKCYPWSNMKRVILAPNGTEIGTLHDDNSNNWADGTAVNWTEVETNGWNVMVRIPKFWFGKKPYNIDGSYDNGHIWIISDKPEEGLELHPAFMRCRDKLSSDQTGIAIEVENRYYGAFAPTLIGGKVRSLPNKSPQIANTMNTLRSQAELNGNGWSAVDYNLLFAVQLLYAVEYGSYDSQTRIGHGKAGTTGETLIQGNHSFGTPNNTKKISYRGIEDLWGGGYFWVDGIVISATDIKIGNKGFNNTGIGYNTIAATVPLAAGSITNIQPHASAGFVPSAIGAEIYTNKFFDWGRMIPNRVALGGGPAMYGAIHGIFLLDFYFNAEGTTTTVISSLSY